MKPLKGMAVQAFLLFVVIYFCCDGLGKGPLVSGLRRSGGEFDEIYSRPGAVEASRSRQASTGLRQSLPELPGHARFRGGKGDRLKVAGFARRWIGR
jgi:hypothetical protein